MRTLSFFIFIFSVVLCIGQQNQNVVVTGRVVDNDQVPIPSVTIKTADTLCVTNKRGFYRFFHQKNQKLTLSFSHSGFSNKKLAVPKRWIKNAKDDSLALDNVMLNNLTITEFTITANRVDTVFGSTQYSVEDFELDSSGKMIVLAYEKTLKKESKILLLDSNQQIIHTHLIPGESIRLFKDFLGDTYVITKYKVLKVEISPKNLITLVLTKNDVFYDFIYRVIDTVGSYYLYSNFNELYPAIKFYGLNTQDSSHQLIKEVKDDFMMELYRAQYKYVSGRDKLWAFRKEQETGVDKEIWIGAAVFTNDILYKPVYAPLLVYYDTLLIFDHYKDLLFCYDSEFNLLNSIAISYHKKVKKQKWSQPLIQDLKTQNIFALFNNGGYFILKKFDINSGEVNSGFKLSNRFVEKVKIINGYAYYIYRPFESIQKKFIYKERISSAK